MKLVHIVLPTENVNETREWYRTFLDLGIEWESDGFVLLTGDDGARLGIHRGTALSESEHVHLHSEVVDVDQTSCQHGTACITLRAPASDRSNSYFHLTIERCQMGWARPTKRHR